MRLCLFCGGRVNSKEHVWPVWLLAVLGVQQLPEVQEYMRQMGERHWDAWLDTRLPALGNRTPRQAAQTPDGRERLEALFAEFTWSTERAPNAMSPDVPALRARLGLR